MDQSGKPKFVDPAPEEIKKDQGENINIMISFSLHQLSNNCVILNLKW